MNSDKATQGTCTQGTWLNFRDAARRPFGSIALSAVLSILFTAFPAHSFVRPSVSVPDKDCTLKNSSVEHYTDLVEKVSIRGEDTREVSSEHEATMPLVCRHSDKKLEVMGTANLIKGNKIVTVLHTIMDLGECIPLTNTGDCYMYDGSKTYPISWKRSPDELCNNSSKDEKDQILVGVLKKGSPNRKPYDIICEEELVLSDGQEVSVIGAMASNFTKTRGPNLGVETLVGSGTIYKHTSRPSNGYIHYDVDTGPKTSGGAVLVSQEGKRYLAGIHVGDRVGGDKKAEAVRQGSRDGLNADRTENFGEGFTFGSEFENCE